MIPYCCVCDIGFDSGCRVGVVGLVFRVGSACLSGCRGVAYSGYYDWVYVTGSRVGVCGRCVW